MNRFAQELCRVCRECLFEEKWLISPSLRVGHQWLDLVTRHAVPVLNVRIKTFKGMALDLAGPAMARTGVSLISGVGASVLVDQILTGLRSDPASYFASLPTSPGLAGTMSAAIEALRSAGISPGQIAPESFETPQKGREIAAVLKEFLESLRDRNLVDYAEVLALATDGLKDNPGLMGPDIRILLPDDMDLGAAERSLIGALDPQTLVTLTVDSVRTISEDMEAPLSDASLLAWVLQPAEAPKASQDGSAEIFHAVGECNEIREVLRRAMSAVCRFDEMELLHTDREVYVPLVYETLMQVLRDPESDDESLPVTFAEGIPSVYSRPGRALTAWMEWMQGNFRQDTLAKMIEDGLLELPAGSLDVPFSRLAGILRATPVGMGRDGYLSRLDSNSGGISVPDAREPFGDAVPQQSGDRQTLCALVRCLLDVSPGAAIPPAELLRAAERFIGNVARKTNELDNYAALALLDQIRELARWVEEDSAPLSLDTAEWLATLPHSVRVGGSGPRPGRLHVDHLLSGGRSGRLHTFIVGLDDGRFPGSGINDPLLLDHERERLSADLPKASSNLRKKLEGVARLFAGLRGRVTLAFPSLDLAEDRSLFPSSVVFSAYRILSNNREGDQGDMFRWLPPAASFAGETPERSLDLTEWWLSRLCRQPVANAQDIVHGTYPHLGRGAKAASARGSDAFTVYDGFLPDPPEDLDPFSAAGPVMSSSRLEIIGQCPLRYFFKYVLGIEPPDEVDMDPERWLDPLQYGNLMHEVFYEFMSHVMERRIRPQFERDKSKLFAVLMKHVERFADRYPPPGPSAFRRQILMLIQAAVVFLVEEELSARNSWPVFLEASIGMPAYGKPCDLHMKEPVSIRLPGGADMRARARIDRVDILGDGSEKIFAIWDYKSGGTTKYDNPDPFREGRVLQHALYMEIVAGALRKKISPSAQVSHFGYFFPGSRSFGARIIRRPDDRDTALGLMERLCTTVSDGCFIATDNAEKDCTFCDYTMICDDLEAVAAASKRKLENDENVNLKSMRELRNIGH